MTESRQSSIKLPPDQESIRARCFHPWGEFVEFPKDDVEASIPERFEKIVRAHPNRLAVKSSEEAFTYDELNKASNRLAWSIIKQCGKKNEPVGALLTHSSAAIVAIVGILKAGKILVDIDASFPIERINAILSDSQAKAIVTDTEHLALVRSLATAEQIVINIEELDRSLSLENPALSLLSQDFAQIIYTSGSTGTPKGVLRDHCTRLHQIMWKINTAHVTREDRCVVLHALSSSGFFLELFRALLSGASSFPFNIKEKGTGQLARLLIQEAVTIYRSLSSTFRTFVETLTEQDCFPHLRLIHVSGEPLYRHDVELYNKHFGPQCILLNHLGASEGGEICNYFVDHQTQIPGNIVPVGFPVGDKEVLVVDDQGKEVDRGDIGEIVVKSRYLSLGYWRNSELTGKSFFSDSSEKEVQRYKTGDFGKMLSDGCVVHVGRKDSRVKIRGYRIEIAEVEAALLEHPAVKGSAAAVWENNAGDNYLMAYVSSRIEPVPTVSELLNFLRGKIPDYMLPSGIIFLENFPLINGKIDRRSLPRPDRIRPRLEQGYTPALTHIEQQLAAIWEDLLDIRPIGIHDNFFDLGGHSLIATRLVSRVLKEFRLEIPLRFLFQSPTVAAMAKVLTEHHGTTLGEKNLESILADLESLSDEKAERLVSEGASLVKNSLSTL